MSAVLTGVTGYLGSYVAHRLLTAGEPLTVLVRASDDVQATMRLWKALQLHLPAVTLAGYLESGQLRFALGDITLPRLGLDEALYARLVEEHDAVVHVAASLNRRSARACFDVNLRGGVEVLQLARRMHEGGGLRRYVHVSTTAVAGHVRGQTLTEEQALAWDRSDWDPYARTKKFGEHLVQELLPDASVVVVRPSTVMGDSRFPETTQFDMVRAFVGLAGLPVLPFDPDARQDIVPADFVADAICALTLAAEPAHRTYHLSAGTGSASFRQITDRLSAELGQRAPRYLPRAGGACSRALKTLADLRWKPLAPVRGGAALMDAFWPYLEWDVVFDNERVARETGLRPASFLDYCVPLYRFARESGFTYPYRPLPPVLSECAGAFTGSATLARTRGCG